MSSTKLDKGQIAEIKEFYLGTHASARELSKRFGVGITCIRWNADSEYRKRQIGNINRYYIAHRKKNNNTK